MNNIDNEIERKFIAYVKLSFQGVRRKFIDTELSRMKKQTSLDSIRCNDINQFTYEKHAAHSSNWLDEIENNDIFLFLKGLSIDDYKLIELIYYQGFSLVDSAKVLGISKQLAFARKKKIITQLRKKLTLDQ